MQFSNKNNGKNICDQFDWHSRNHTNKLKYENEKSEKNGKKKRKNYYVYWMNVTFS